MLTKIKCQPYLDLILRVLKHVGCELEKEESPHWVKALGEYLGSTIVITAGNASLTVEIKFPSDLMPGDDEKDRSQLTASDIATEADVREKYDFNRTVQYSDLNPDACDIIALGLLAALHSFCVARLNSRLELRVVPRPT